jgi:hypothetical protein
MTQPVDGIQHRALHDHPALQLIFTGKVDKHDANQNGENALAGQYQHGDAENNKDVSECIFGNQQRPSDNRMFMGPRFPSVTFILGEIIFRNSDYQYRNEQQAAYEAENGKGSHEPEVNFVLYYPVEHTVGLIVWVCKCRAHIIQYILSNAFQE